MLKEKIEKQEYFTYFTNYYYETKGNFKFIDFSPEEQTIIYKYFVMKGSQHIDIDERVEIEEAIEKMFEKKKMYYLHWILDYDSSAVLSDDDGLEEGSFYLANYCTFELIRISNHWSSTGKLKKRGTLCGWIGNCWWSISKTKYNQSNAGIIALNKMKKME